MLTSALCKSYQIWNQFIIQPCVRSYLFRPARRYNTTTSKSKKIHHPRPFWCWNLERFCTRIWNEGRHPRRCPIHFICWINFFPPPLWTKKGMQSLVPPALGFLPIQNTHFMKDFIQRMWVPENPMGTVYDFVALATWGPKLSCRAIHIIHWETCQALCIS